MIKAASPSGWGALPAFIWCNPDLTDLQVRVLGVLSCHHATSEKNWPSLPIIAAFCGKERKAVQRALHGLQRLQLVDARPQFDRETGAQLATVWVQRFDRFNVEKQRAIVPVKRRRRPEKDSLGGVKNDPPPLVENDARPGVENDARPGVENDAPAGVKNDAPAGVSSAAPVLQAVIQIGTSHPLNPPLGSGGNESGEEGQGQGRQTRLQLANAQVAAARTTRAQRELHKRAAAGGAKCELCNRQVLWSDSAADLVLLTPDGPLCHASCLQLRPDFTVQSWQQLAEARELQQQDKRKLQRRRVLQQTLPDLRPEKTVAELDAELQAGELPQQRRRLQLRELAEAWRRYEFAQAELAELDAELQAQREA